MIAKFLIQLMGVFLIVILLVGCGWVQNTAPTPEPGSIPPASSIPTPSTATPPALASFLSEYAFPEPIDPTKRYLFYLHGRIIEEQGIPAVSPDYGAYEYEAILEKLAKFDFIVISEQRLKNSDADEFAKRVERQVLALLNAGVPAPSITIVGASKGAYIAIRVSHLLENQEIKYVVMGICNAEIIADLKQNQVFLYGQVLSIYDFADDQYGGSCAELFTLSDANGGLSKYDEIVLNVGTGHGILYKPLDEWVIPVKQWAENP